MKSFLQGIYKYTHTHIKSTLQNSMQQNICMNTIVATTYAKIYVIWLRGYCWCADTVTGIEIAGTSGREWEIGEIVCQGETHSYCYDV